MKNSWGPRGRCAIFSAIYNHEHIATMTGMLDDNECITRSINVFRVSKQWKVGKQDYECKSRVIMPEITGPIAVYDFSPRIVNFNRHDKILFRGLETGR